MGGIGGPELFIVLLVVLLVFGPKKIPQVAREIGKGLREFRRLSTELQREINLADDEEGSRRRIAKPAPPPAAEGTEPRTPPSSSAPDPPEPPRDAGSL